MGFTRTNKKPGTFIVICSLAFLAACNSTSDSSENSQPVTETAIQQKKEGATDSLISTFCVEKGIIKHKSGDTTNNAYAKTFIESSLQRSVKDLQKADYCVDTGLLKTAIKSVDSLRNLEFSYYILSDFSNNKELAEYKTRIDSLEYDKLSPVTEAPHTNYHFTKGDRIIILSHYGLEMYYPKYDVKEYIGVVKERK